MLYPLDPAHLGQLTANDVQVVQKVPVNAGHVMGGPVFWDSSAAGPLVYNWAEDDVLRSYRMSNGRLVTPSYSQGGVMSPGHPGGSLTLSANGGCQGTGIVWASMPTSQDGVHGPVAGILRAYDAETLREIWNSEQNAARDRIGTLMKFVPPVVVKGKVYLPNQDGAVAVFGLLPAPVADFSLAVSPSARAIAAGQSGTFAVAVTASGGFGDSVALSAVGQPAGTTISFAPASITGAGSSTMVVSLPPDVADGTYPVTIQGSSGDQRSLGDVADCHRTRSRDRGQLRRQQHRADGRNRECGGRAADELEQRGWGFAARPIWHSSMPRATPPLPR